MENYRLKMLGKIDHDPIPSTKIKAFHLTSTAFASINPLDQTRIKAEIIAEVPEMIHHQTEAIATERFANKVPDSEDRCWRL